MDFLLRMGNSGFRHHCKQSGLRSFTYFLIYIRNEHATSYSNHNFSNPNAIFFYFLFFYVAFVFLFFFLFISYLFFFLNIFLLFFAFLLCLFVFWVFLFPNNGSYCFFIAFFSFVLCSLFWPSGCEGYITYFIRCVELYCMLVILVLCWFFI